MTPREREVATLIAQARSNGEIAEERVVSRRTLETYVSHILDTLWFRRYYTSPGLPAPRPAEEPS